MNLRPCNFSIFNYKMKCKFCYKEAIDKLNKLTSNITVIKEAAHNKIKQKKIKRDSTLRYLEYTGYSRKQLKKLSVIHIAGTKGKGSTSSMCESILRNYGYRTGFYSSPHLVSVTERIKIDGLSLKEDYFAEVFSDVYQNIHNNMKKENDMPPYFGFLTVMALNIFITQKVDVAIIEVGIGGEYDQTNVVSNVPVAGITSLGYDHTNLLGNTMEEIAKQKAGIMKHGTKVYTVNQPIEAMKVLRDTAKIKKCQLNVVPDYESYNWLDTNNEKNLKLNNPTKHLNASLAIQLAHNWMKYKESYEKHKFDNIYKKSIIKDPPLKTFVGLQSSFWPGRCQILTLENEDYYLDGAHTVESMSVCSQWFKHQSRKSSLKVLIFHITGDRNPEPMLKLLLECEFDMALFVPNVAYDEKENKNSIDQVCTNVEEHRQVESCKQNAEVWRKLVSAYKPNKEVPNIGTFTNMSSGFNYVSSYYKSNEFERPQILVTGSLLLVGTALTILDPLLNKSK